MCVKLPPGDLNPDLCPLHSKNTYTLCLSPSLTFFCRFRESRTTHKRYICLVLFIKKNYFIIKIVLLNASKTLDFFSFFWKFWGHDIYKSNILPSFYVTFYPRFLRYGLARAFILGMLKHQNCYFRKLKIKNLLHQVC